MDPVYIALNAPVKTGRGKLIRRAIDNITKNIDQLELKSREEYKDMYTKFVKLDLRETQLNRISELLKDIDYAEPVQIPALYEYRNRDEQDKIKIALESAKEHKEGKLDPKQFEKR